MVATGLVGLAMVPGMAKAQCASGGYGGFGGYGHFGQPHIYQQHFGGYQSHWHNTSFLPCTYNGWSNQCWFNQYRCRGFYCPQRQNWFYYYQPRNCYLPVSYMNQFPPVNQNFNQNVNQNTNINQNININGNPIGGIPGLPAGAVALPGGFPGTPWVEL